MSDVIIRCPNCGTTHAALGECDACHEAQTRYFCPNHEPGKWLEGAVCPACGARVGGGPAPRPPRPTRPTPRAPTRPPVRPPVTLGSRPALPDEPERIIEELLRSVHTPRGGEVAEPSAGDARDAWPSEPSLPPATVSVLPVAGCIRRFVLTILFLLALGALILFGLFTFGGQLFGASKARVPTALTAHGTDGAGPHRREIPKGAEFQEALNSKQR
jgi:hypothetical protein